MMKSRCMLLSCALLFVLSSQQLAHGQGLPHGPDPCKDSDIEVGGTMDEGGGAEGGDDDHFTLNIDMKGAGELLGEVADFFCTLFPCPGTGGDGGGEDPPGEDPPGEDPPGEDPPGEDPPGEDPPGGDTGDDDAESTGVCTTGGYSFDKLLNSFAVTQSQYKNGAFHIQLASGTQGRLDYVTVHEAILLPRPVKRAARLRGNWYVKAGTYPVQKNRVQISVEKR